MALTLSNNNKKQNKGNTNDPNVKLPAGLYLVATPIGNLKDITLRSIETLKSADAILCEDTRVSGKLLNTYDIKKPLLSLHDHNEESRAAHIISEIEAGKTIALISDAGMPMISDPGYKLVSACLDAGVMVTSTPGASSVLMALQLSGLPSDKFSFLGFLPTKSKARQDILTEWQDVPATLIMFENGLRVIDTCVDIQKIYGERQMTLARELTKLFEDIWRGTPKDIINHIETNGPPKGEVVLIIAGKQKSDTAAEHDVDELLKAALQNHSVKDAVAMVVDQTGLKKKDIYARALTIQN